MTARPSAWRRAVAPAASLLLAACAAVPPPTASQQQAQSACRSRADEVYLTQNRYLLSQRGNLDAPNSGGNPDFDQSLGTASLAGQYDRSRLVADCIRGSAAPAAAGTAPAAGDQGTQPPAP